MNIDDNQYQQQQPLRRSQRLKNKQNGNNGLQLTGDKRYIFTHDFNQDNTRKRKQNIENNNNNNNNKDRNENKSSFPIYPTISRSARKLQVVHTSPNVFIIENFLTEKEITHLLSIAKMNKSKFETSYTQASSTDQIYSKERTSTFIFLQKYMDRISRSIERRAAEIVSIPIENVEPLQVVRYTDGQEFTLHHDAGTLINETVKKSSSSSLWSVDSHNSNHSHHSNHSSCSNMSYSVNSNHSNGSNGSNASNGANSFGGHSMDYIYNTQFLNNCNNINININSSNYHQQNNFNNCCTMNNNNNVHQNMNQNMNGNVMHTMNNMNNMNTTNLNINNCQNIMNQTINNNNNNINLYPQSQSHYNQTQNQNNNNMNRTNNNSSVHSNVNMNNIPFPAQIRQLQQMQMQQSQSQYSQQTQYQQQQQQQQQSSPPLSSSPQCPGSPITPSSPIPQLPPNQMSSNQYAQYFQKLEQMANQRKKEILLAQQGMAQAQRMYNSQCNVPQIMHQMGSNSNNYNKRGQSVHVPHAQTTVNHNNHNNRERYYRPSQSCPPLSSQLQVFKMNPNSTLSSSTLSSSTDNNNMIRSNADNIINIVNNNNNGTDCTEDHNHIQSQCHGIKKEKEVSTDYHMSDIMEDDDDEDNLSKEEYAEQFNEYSVQMVTPIRLCSYFVYLTTLPEGAGGETYFPKLGLKVRPERGKAILWCNVDPENTSKADPLLIHRAMPVKGDHEKIGMNIWINGSKVDASYR